MALPADPPELQAEHANYLIATQNETLRRQTPTSGALIVQEALDAVDKPLAKLIQRRIRDGGLKTYKLPKGGKYSPDYVFVDDLQRCVRSILTGQADAAAGEGA